MRLLEFVFILIVYDTYFFNYFKHMFPVKNKYLILYAAAVFINISITLPAYLLLDHYIAIFFAMGSIMLGFFLLFRVNRIQILYAGSVYMFSIYSSRGIISSIYSMVLHISIHDILQYETYYNEVMALAVLLSILSITFVRKIIVPDNKARNAFTNNEQLGFTIVCLNSQLFFLMFINTGLYYNEIKSVWYSALYLGASLISKLCLQFVFHHTAKVVELLEYELHTRKLQEQLSRQMRHYQAYRKFTESYRIFRHDYKNMMTSVKVLMNNKEYEKAARMLDDIQDTMQREVLIHKTYSDNVLLDAILQDAANACGEKGIRFSAHALLPKDVQMSELDIVRIFSNAIENAIEACSKVPDKERFIETTGAGSREWATIEIANSFNGELSLSGGEPATTKEDKEIHGFGLRIIKETVEGLGGLVIMEPDQEKRIFKIRICIPRSSF